MSKKLILKDLEPGDLFQFYSNDRVERRSGNYMFPDNGTFRVLTTQPNFRIENTEGSDWCYLSHNSLDREVTLVTSKPLKP